MLTENLAGEAHSAPIHPGSALRGGPSLLVDPQDSVSRVALSEDPAQYSPLSERPRVHSADSAQLAAALLDRERMPNRHLRKAAIAHAVLVRS